MEGAAAVRPRVDQRGGAVGRHLGLIHTADAGTHLLQQRAPLGRRHGMRGPGPKAQGPVPRGATLTFQCQKFSFDGET